MGLLVYNEIDSIYNKTKNQRVLVHYVLLLGFRYYISDVIHTYHLELINI